MIVVRNPIPALAHQYYERALVNLEYAKEDRGPLLRDLRLDHAADYFAQAWQVILDNEYGDC